MDMVNKPSKLSSVSAQEDQMRLREHGLRVTAPRLSTLAVIRESGHMSADAVATAVRDRLGSISKQAIYDVLTVLTDVHIIRRVVIEGRGAWYELEAGDNHHHITCTRCGRFDDIPCVTGVAPCLDPPEDLGYIIEKAEVVYRGICPACQQSESSD